MLPIVQRELRVGARNPRLYGRRMRWGAVQAVAACLVLTSSGGGFRRSSAEWFFSALSVFALLFCVLEGLRKTSDAISSEKRDGTLGLLFLSTLSGADVVLGKFGSAIIRSLSGLLTFLPIMAISLLVGGTTLGEFWRVSLALAGCLLEALAICLLVSTLSRERAVAGSITAVAGITLLPLFGGLTNGAWHRLELFSPLAACRVGRDLFYRRAPGEFWIGMAFLALITITALAAASFLLPRIWQERRGFRAKALVRRQRAEKRAELLGRNPVFWLTYDAGGAKWLNRAGVLLLIFGVLPLIAMFLEFGDRNAWLVFPAATGWILVLLIWVRVAILSATTIAEEKQNGSLELLLTTPLTTDEVIHGHWLSLWTSVRFAVFCGLGLLMAGIIASRTYVAPAVAAVMVLAECAMLAWIGMWMGLTSKNRAAAVVYTVVIGVLPSVCALGLPLQIFLFLRGRSRVKRILTEMRWNGGQRLEDLLRSANILNPNVPPVIRYSTGQRL